MRTLLVLIFLSFAALPAWAQTVKGTATVLEAKGEAQYRTGPGGPWQAVRVNQRLTPGQTLRTGKQGRLALLLSDRTQVRLNANTVLEIQAIEPAPRTAGQTKFRQLQGRAWVQSKTPPKDLKWETPTAIAGIRGTDWEMDVDQDGHSTLSVFSGQVELANDQGSLNVNANEQARATPGQPLVKQVVRNLKDRIQWVTAYSLDPVRHIALDGRDLPDLRAALADPALAPETRGQVLADLGRWAEAEALWTGPAQAGNRPAMIGLALASLRRGEMAAAHDWLAQARSDTADELWLLTDSARLMLQGQLDEARTRLGEIGAPSRPGHWLLQGESLTYEGRLTDALTTLDQGLKVLPHDHRLLAARARALLLDDQPEVAQAAAEQAIAANLSSYEGWLARAEIAHREGQAETALGAYDLAIALKPEDDRAWFGRGTAQAEREFIREARGDLEQAMTLNPRGAGYVGEQATLETLAGDFAEAESLYRAALQANPGDYVALTGQGLLQLKRGQADAALDSFLKAGVMEPRYARAHVYTAVAYYQAGDVKQALDELRLAGELDDKDPLPHFMAAMIHSDRVRPADAVDAARAALERMPYLKSLNQLANDQQGSANLGQSLAFFGLEDWARAYAQESYSPYWAGSHLFLADRYNGLFTKNSELFQGLLSDPTVFGAGKRFKPLIPAPRHNLDLSLRYTDTKHIHGWSPQVEVSGYDVAPMPMAYFLNYEGVDWTRFDRPYDLDTLTAAFGMKPDHDLGVFFFADASKQDSRPAGSLNGDDYDLADTLHTRRLDLGVHYKLRPDNQIWLKAGYFDSSEKMAGTLGFDDILARTAIKVPEFGFRHSLDSRGGHQISWGIDGGRRNTDGNLNDQFFLGEKTTLKESSLDLFLSDTLALNSQLSLQADLVYQRQRRRAVEQPYLVFAPPEDPPLTPEIEHQDRQQLNPRLGLVYRPDTHMRFRLAYQDWLRPMTFSALQPVATAGIALDDTLVQRGGELQRLRLQGEWEPRADTFLMGYLDVKEIDNHRFNLRPFGVENLESLGKLRPRDMGSLMRDDLHEFFTPPDYAGGKVNSLGLSVNHILNREWAVNGRYTLTESRHQDDGDLDVPYLPRHAAALGATWVRPDGWYLAGRLTYRGKRYADELNNARLDADWTGDLDVFKESRDKNWLLRFSANNLFGDPDPQYTAELNYRF